MGFKIKQNLDCCIGCGACIAVCPDNWKMEGAKAIPIKEEMEEIGCNQKAADVCPVNCIEIVEE